MLLEIESGHYDKMKGDTNGKVLSDYFRSWLGRTG
jgi:hypothetical protein